MGTMVEFISKGVLVSASLILAIGSQNAFVLKQGLLKEHIFYVCFLCFICDVILMSIGVFGLGDSIQSSPLLTNIFAIAGICFLLFYGINSFINSYKGMNCLTITNQAAYNSQQLTKVIATTLAVSLLNPHVYLDTVIIIGSFSATMNTGEKSFFLIGALIASFIWFFSLGYGSRLLIPLFKRNTTWQVFDFIVGIIMLWIAFNLFMLIINN